MNRKAEAGGGDGTLSSSSGATLSVTGSGLEVNHGE